MEAARPVARGGPKRGYIGEKSRQLPEIRRQPTDRPTLRYLQYLRKMDDHQAGVQTCLPPLNIRTVQGKYRECITTTTTSSSSTQNHGAQTATSTNTLRIPSVGLRAKSVGLAARREEPSARTKACSDAGMYSFPRQFWEGPVFQIYKNSPKLRSSMNLRRLRALKSLLSVADFENKTGLWEKEYDTGDDDLMDLLDMTSSARKARDGSRPPSKMGSEHSHRKSVIANRLPTIDDE